MAQDDEVPPARLRVKPKPVEEWEVNDLIDHFIAKVRYAARKDRLRLPVNAFNRGMLAGNLNRWLVEDDVDAVEVKAIIDHFVAAYRQFHKPGADPGKVFIANRRKIHAGVDFNQQTSLSRDVNVLVAGRTFKIPGEK